MPGSPALLSVVDPFDESTATATEPFDAYRFGVRATASAVTNVAAIRAALADISVAGGGELLFSSLCGTFDVAFDDVVTQYYGLFKVRSNTTVRFETGAKMRVTGSLPAIFAGVFGPDVTALPVRKVRFEHVFAEDTISGTDPQKVRFATFTPTNTMAADSVHKVTFYDCDFENFASPILFASRNSALGAWERECSDINVVHCRATGCISSFVTADAKDITIAFNHAYGDTATPTNSYDAVSIHAAVGAQIIGNNFGFFAHASGITIHIQNSNVAVNGVVKGTRTVRVLGNYIHDTFGASKEIGVSVIGSSPLGCTDISVVDNTIVRGGRGIQFNQNGDIGSPFHTLVANDNKIHCHERGIDFVGNTTAKNVYDFSCNNNKIRIVPSAETTTLTGTVATMAAAGTALAGTGTLFTTELAVGNFIDIAGWPVKVTAIADDTNATVSAYPGRVSAAGSTILKYGAGVTTANSWGLRVLNAERGTISNNTVVVINGSTNCVSANLDTMRDVAIATNTFVAADLSISSFTAGATAAMSGCGFTGNTIHGLTTWAAGKFTAGSARNNRFKTSGALFNGHDVGGVTFGLDGTRFWKYGTAAPASESWNQYDEVINSTKTEAGGAGSMYVIEKWFCSVASPDPGTWLEQRTLTGN